MRRSVLWFALVLSTTGCLHLRGEKLPAPVNIPAIKGKPTTAFALRWIDVRVGTGEAVIPRGCVYAHYTGWLTDGTKFDSSRDTTARGTPREPIAFPLGQRRVIAGWDAGFDGMQVGGQRRLFIPYQLAYGAEGRGPTIPPKATLIFDIELMAVAPVPAPGTQCAPLASVRGDGV
jgi:peptidylprolyl isomerase